MRVLPDEGPVDEVRGPTSLANQTTAAVTSLTTRPRDATHINQWLRTLLQCLRTNNWYSWQNLQDYRRNSRVSTSILTTGDGYKWKYMYTLSASQQANFLSTDFMAVATDSTVSSGAVTTSTDSAPFNGAPIDTFLVTSQGSGYPDGTYYV